MFGKWALAIQGLCGRKRPLSFWNTVLPRILAELENVRHSLAGDIDMPHGAYTFLRDMESWAESLS